ncbi:hypothetical protein BSK59_14120 [Paenibacillus odorifer]|uniref:hypothetical protein n=1 Tax=Paenibacillus odorifer TaxID=189426 RepID=UPI00096DF207|nr:hypothetical protein [Paenibacillus odorifer]OME55604.1 hypothetical protein BSK59_14120 [Paenibacillus odorifer]
MYICPKTGSMFLREEDLNELMNKEYDYPLISIGQILSTNLYDVETNVRCYAIIPFQNLLFYYFEWLDTDTDKWTSIFTLKGNNALNDAFLNQL